MDLEDRQAAAIAILGGFFVLVLPIVVLLGSALVAAWLDIVGVHDVHRVIFGWMSTTSTDKAGHTKFAVAPWTWHYFICVVSVYVIYQLCEAGAIAFGAFKKALT